MTNQRCDDGFTLVELLVVSIILPVVIGALSLGIITVFSQQAKVVGRLSGSSDLQKMTATFVRDVQSATLITNEATDQVCGSSGTQILGLMWSADRTAVSYVVVPNGSGGTTGYDQALERLQCDFTNVATPPVVSAAPTSVRVVSVDIPSVGSSVPQPTVGICVGTVTTSNCPVTPQPLLDSSSIAQVQMTVNIPMSSAPYVMVASPRASQMSGSLTNGPSLPAPLTILGTGNCNVPSLTVRNATLTVTASGGAKGSGVIALESSCANTVALSNNGSICASAFETSYTGNGSVISVPKHPGSCPPSPPAFPNPLGYPGPGSTFYSTFPNGSLNPTAPTAPTNVVQCSEISSNDWTCPPGLYGSFPAPGKSLKNNSVITFTGANPSASSPEGGRYCFSTSVIIPNGSNVSFGYGTYMFDAMSGNALDVAGTNGVVLNASGALFYAPTASMNFGNNATITMAPNPYSGFDGISIWDNSTGSVTLSNNNTDSYGGIYVPNGSVTTEQNGGLNATFIVAASATFYNGSTITVTAP